MENNCSPLINFIDSNKEEFFIFKYIIERCIREVDDLEKKLKNNNQLQNFLYSILDIKDRELLKEKLNLFYETKIDENLTFKDIIKIKIYKENKISVQFLQDKSKYFNKNKFIYEYNLDVIPISKKFIESSFAFDNNLKEIIDKYFPKMIVIFIMHFETFFSELLKFIVSKNDNFLFEKWQHGTEPTLTYSEILKNPTQDWKEYIIDRQINKLTYDIIQSIDKLIKFTKTESFIQTNFPDLESTFKEIYYRRNLIIHNNSIVNEGYKNNIGLKDSNIGQKLTTDLDYVFKSFKTCNKFAYLLYAIFGKKLTKEDKTHYYHILDDYAFIELLKKSNWEEALFVYKLLLEFYSIDNANKLNYIFNIYNCQKHLNDLSYKDELLKIDISANDIIYKIGKHLLLDDNEEVYKLLMDYYPHYINDFQILEWPIFIDFRETEEFLKFKSEKLTNLNDDYAIEI